MRCPFCRRSHVQRSRLRLSDFPELIIGRLPMRCLDCLDRFFVWLPQVFIAQWTHQSKRRIEAQ
jgi:transcriptional regulator NrdR family protein